MAVFAFLVIGLAGVGGGGWLVYSELARPATRAEVIAAGQAEVASRWERLSGRQIFPAIIHYAAPSGLVTTAYRVGIAPRSSCHAALDPPLAAALGQKGCTTVLRASCTDASRAFMLTAGIAVMPNATSARAPCRASAPASPMAACGRWPFPGRWRTYLAPRRTTGSASSTPAHTFSCLPPGPPTGPVRVAGLNPALVDLAFGVERPLAAQLAEQARNPCQDQDIQC